MLRKGPLSLLHWNTLGIKNRITRSLLSRATSPTRVSSTRLAVPCISRPDAAHPSERSAVRFGHGGGFGLPPACLCSPCLFRVRRAVVQVDRSTRNHRVIFEKRR